MDFAEIPMLWEDKVCYSCTGDATLKISVHQLLLIPISLFLFLQDIKSSRKAFKGEFSGKEIIFL